MQNFKASPSLHTPPPYVGVPFTHCHPGLPDARKMRITWGFGLRSTREWAGVGAFVSCFRFNSEGLCALPMRPALGSLLEGMQRTSGMTFK